MSSELHSLISQLSERLSDMEEKYTKLEKRMFKRDQELVMLKSSGTVADSFQSTTATDEGPGDNSSSEKDSDTQAISERVFRKLEERMVDDRCMDYYKTQTEFHSRVLEDLENEDLPPGRDPSRDESPFWMHRVKVEVDRKKCLESWSNIPAKGCAGLFTSHGYSANYMSKGNGYPSKGSSKGDYRRAKGRNKTWVASEHPKSPERQDVRDIPSDMIRPDSTAGRILRKLKLRDCDKKVLSYYEHNVEWHDQELLRDLENDNLPPNRDPTRDESPYWMAQLKKKISIAKSRAGHARRSRSR